MLKTTVIGAICFAVGIFVTLSITSQSWLVASLRHNFTWNNSREWFGALSGWAAFAAAVVSIKYLIGQWQEARKQTRFVIGDDDPTLDVIEHLQEKKRLVIRIVNWNRRAIFIKDIVTSTRTTPADMNQASAIIEARNVDGEIDQGFPIQINGWEDRSARPHYVRIDLLLLQKTVDKETGIQTDESIEFPLDATISVKIQMLGNVHRIFEIEASAFPLE